MESYIKSKTNVTRVLFRCPLGYDAHLPVGTPLGIAVSASIGTVSGENVYHTGRSSGNIEGVLYKDSADNLYSQVSFLSRLSDLCGTYHSNGGNRLMLFYFAQLSLSPVSLHNLAAVEERIKSGLRTAFVR